MRIDFRTGKENHIIDDILDSKADGIELLGFYSDDKVVIKDWKFINYKRRKWVQLNTLNFVNCTFKDVHFMGAVPMHQCTFKNCTFENCILTDHIRWNKFDGCTFKFCLFSGYFHGSTFKANCTYDKVLMRFYGDDSHFNGVRTNKDGFDRVRRKIAAKNKDEDEILRFFYPAEMAKLDEYPIGRQYLIRKIKYGSFDIYKDGHKIVKIDGKEYYIDTVKRHQVDFTNYKLELRIVGTYAPLIGECIPEDITRRVLVEKF